jgi:putative DNA methylase
MVKQMTKKRLIEVAFPLKQTSIDSVHEKNVRHGHISTLHIWPARRPLAACRAALVTTLLDDPENEEERLEILERLAGRVVQRVKRVRNAEGKIEEKIVEETEGGILHWGRESGPDLEWFREKIRGAYGGRAPKVLDPFAGGGAIPLEAMRLGCEATAVDINPVSWFILKCTLEYPQKLAGQTRPLPDFALQDREFMQVFFKAQGIHGQALKTRLEQIGHAGNEKDNQLGFDLLSESPGKQAAIPEADLAWHVRAWGRWVLAQARSELARFYPTYADFEPLVKVTQKVETRPMQLVPLNEDGTPDLDALNAEFDEAYLRDKRNPRWVAKPTVAYLWARTVTCKNCRATIPLLKTRWLCKKANKRVALTIQPNKEKTGVIFGVQVDVPVKGENTSQRKANDKEIGSGTMSRSGANCPCCGAIMTLEDIRLEGQAGRLGALMTSVVVDGVKGKEYRLPTETEILLATEVENEIESVYSGIPFGLPDEPTPSGGGSGAGRAFSIQNYGWLYWRDLFTKRQLLALGVFILNTYNARSHMKNRNYPLEWLEALGVYLGTIFSRTLDYMAILCVWEKGAEEVKHVFMRWALPITWDYAEANPIAPIERFYAGGINSAQMVLSRLIDTDWENTFHPNVLNQSAIKEVGSKVDLIFTDPPYYDAIPYSDLMDFFYIWLKRSVSSLSPTIDDVFKQQLAPKWDSSIQDGELIDDESRHGGSSDVSKKAYEDGMYRAFVAGYNKLALEGRMVVVFANKNPFAWETLVASIIRAGFCVTGSWPIASEMPGGLRNLNRASLASSIWLVCKKRPEATRPGWDRRVLDEMRHNIINQLRNFWDAGIRGPDFVWAATGPALEAYSQYPAVKKANKPGELMTVGEFLRHVRRMVVDFVVGRVLTLTPDEGLEQVDVSGLDDVTTYYLLHRHDFGFEEAPAGACILYAVSCGLSDRELVDRYDLLTTVGKPRPKSNNGEQESEYEESSGSTLRLKGWKERKSPSLGLDPVLDKSTARLPLFPEMEIQSDSTRNQPLIDQVHRLMHLWRGGDVNRVNDYLDLHGLRRNQLFQQLLQALIELAPAGSEERVLLESISNHIGVQGKSFQMTF